MGAFPKNSSCVPICGLCSQTLAKRQTLDLKRLIGAFPMQPFHAKRRVMNFEAEKLKLAKIMTYACDRTYIPKQPLERKKTAIIAI